MTVLVETPKISQVFLAWYPFMVCLDLLTINAYTCIIAYYEA